MQILPDQMLRNRSTARQSGQWGAIEKNQENV